MLFSTDFSQLDLICPQAAQFVRDHDLVALDPGRYDLPDGDFVNVIEYEPKHRAAAQYEAHRDYADLQVEIRGEELIEVESVGKLSQTKPYDADDDYALYDGATLGETFLLRPGRFCLLVPGDGHMPSIATTGEPVSNKKAVFKIRLENLPSRA
ncbi:MAG: YhcH/YjgK/YiaL family protein [Coriobacteriales bacterium]|jgi:biofilm protein TabA